MLHINDVEERLKRNPEYPKLLINMGYGYIMEEKYYSLCKTPLSPFKDKVKTILKDAFTFDSSHHP